LASNGYAIDRATVRGRPEIDDALEIAEEIEV